MVWLLCPHRYIAYWYPNGFLGRFYKRPRVYGQFVERAAVGDIFLPPWQCFVDRFNPLHLVAWERQFIGFAIQVIGRANAHFIQSAQDIELHQRQFRISIQPDTVAKRRQIEPAAVALATGRGAELKALVSQVQPGLIGDGRRERSCTDGCCIRLGDACHAVDG